MGYSSMNGRFGTKLASIFSFAAGLFSVGGFEPLGKKAIQLLIEVKFSA